MRQAAAALVELMSLGPLRAGGKADGGDPPGEGILFRSPEQGVPDAAAAVSGGNCQAEDIHHGRDIQHLVPLGVDKTGRAAVPLCQEDGVVLLTAQSAEGLGHCVRRRIIAQGLPAEPGKKCAVSDPGRAQGEAAHCFLPASGRRAAAGTGPPGWNGCGSIPGPRCPRNGTAG